MATNHSSKRPVTTLRCGNIKVTILQNVNEKGPFFATTFSPPVKDQSGGWRNGASFGLNDFEAKEWITTHTLNHRSASAGSLRPSRDFPSTILLFQSFQTAELEFNSVEEAAQSGGSLAATSCTGKDSRPWVYGALVVPHLEQRSCQ